MHKFYLNDLVVIDNIPASSVLRSSVLRIWKVVDIEWPFAYITELPRWDGDPVVGRTMTKDIHQSVRRATPEEIAAYIAAKVRGPRLTVKFNGRDIRLPGIY